jgi:plasmid maintenance system antidote protein VapI/Zn-dependent peptidase ImmA (M78 family)
MSQSDLARRMNRPIKTINEIINGKASITAETAIQLERVVGVPSTFWNSLERGYREDIARIEEHTALAQQKDWLKQFPLKDMFKLGAPIRQFNSSVEQLEELLRFFRVSSPAAWDRQLSAHGALFRQSAIFAAHPPAVDAWVRWAEIEAEEIDCKPFSATRFVDALAQIRKLTPADPTVFVARMQMLCAAAGVAVVFIHELPRTRLSGATKWLSQTKAMIALSLYGKSDDRLWFSFFHEAGHILLHGKRDGFLDTDRPNQEVSATDPKEEQANRFSADFLIPPAEYDDIASSHKNSSAVIARFARSIGIAPGIVVGRLQHDGLLPHNYCNELKRRYDWAKPAP